MHMLIKHFILTELVIINLFYKIFSMTIFYQVTVFLGSWFKCSLDAQVSS